MSRALDWNSFFKAAQHNLQPRYRKLRGMDADDWLATFGLERRSVAVDIAQAAGLTLLGCAVGVGLGLMFAPKAGPELRRQLNQRVRGTAQRLGVNIGEKEQPTYAS